LEEQQQEKTMLILEQPIMEDDNPSPSRPKSRAYAYSAFSSSIHVQNYNGIQVISELKRKLMTLMMTGQKKIFLSHPKTYKYVDGFITHHSFNEVVHAAVSIVNDIYEAKSCNSNIST
jgi:hypothetical protein